MVAILLALLTCPCESKVTINTDSQCSIDIINGVIKLGNSLTTRQYFKLKNRTIAHKIGKLIREKSLEVYLIKVKAHIGILENEKVDVLAKEAIYESSDMIYKDKKGEFTGGIVWQPKFKDIIIEDKIRPFIKKIVKEIIETEWSLGKSFVDLFHGYDKGIDWEITWGVFRNIKGIRCKSMDMSWLISWFLKSLNELLPYGKELKKRRPDLYNQWKCPFCNREEEDNQHICICSNTQNEWQEIERHVNMAITEQLGKYEIDPIIIDNIVRRFTTMLFRNNDNKYLWSRVLIYKEFMEVLKKTKLGANKNRKILTKLVGVFHKNFKDFIWKKRCDLINIWEKSRGINQREKKKGSPAHNNRSDTNNTNKYPKPNTNLTELDTVQVLDDIDDYNPRQEDKVPSRAALRTQAKDIAFSHIEDSIKSGRKAEWIFQKKDLNKVW